MVDVHPFAAHCLELLSTLGVAHARRMFGGHGLYLNALFVGLIASDVLYLKADDAARPAFEVVGCRPFGYTAAGAQRAVMAWWSAPDDAMESPAQMLPWARLAMASALRAAAAKRPATPAKPRATARQEAPASARDAASGRRAAAGVRPRPKSPGKA